MSTVDRPRSELVTPAFWLDTLERTIRTAAQAAIALLVANAATPMNIDWAQGGITVAIAAALTVLTALAGKTVGSPDTPSVLPPLQPHPAPYGAVPPVPQNTVESVKRDVAVVQERIKR